MAELIFWRHGVYRLVTTNVHYYAIKIHINILFINIILFLYMLFIVEQTIFDVFLYKKINLTFFFVLPIRFVFLILLSSLIIIAFSDEVSSSRLKNIFFN